MLSKSSLKTRLALILGFVALVGSLVLSQVATHLSQVQIAEDQGALMQNVAANISADLASDLSTRASEILFLASLERVRDPSYPAAGKRAIFERAHTAYPFYAWIGMTDPAGTIVAATDGLLVGASVAERDWFLKGREGLHFGDAHDAFMLAKLLPKPARDDLPLRLVDISTPVRTADGRLLGVICGHLSLDWAFEAREVALAGLKREQFDLIVLNRGGLVLMGTPRLPSLSANLSSLEAYQGLAKSGRRTLVETWPDGTRYLTAAVREAPFRNYPGMGWTVIARTAEREAFRPAAELSRLILLGGLATALLIGAAFWGVLKDQLRPLEEVADAAQRIREADLSTTIPQPAGEGEIAVLARSLTGLVRDLQDRNAELKLAGRVFEESGQGILICDAQARILRVNRSFTRITGFSPVDVVGRTPAIMKSGLHDREFYQAIWTEVRHRGRWQGEIWNRAKSGHVYPEWLNINALVDAGGTVTNYIGIFDDITEKKAYETRLVHLANYDQLTDLPNRNLMQRQAHALVEKHASSAGGVALLFVDLDMFKHINDTLGHPAGDLALREVAARLRSAVPPEDLLARWGGDEFVVACPVADEQAARQVARRLADTLREPVEVEGARYHLSMSVGIALCPSHGTAVDELLRCADIAMYKAKEEGPNSVRLYEPTMQAAVEHVMRIKNELRRCLDADGLGFTLAFQPQFAPDGLRIVGAEALLRWNAPALGALAPGQFIGVAEDSGQIVALGRWVARRAVESFAQLRATGREPVPVSVNCSALQLSEGSVVAALQEACAANAVAPGQIVVEVTESALMGNEGRAMATLGRLRELGFRISIDDFGTGFSWLGYLRKIRPSELKISQEFVRNVTTDPGTRSIISFALSLAASMDMEVVAEGVETREQFDALQRIGPTRIQGFLLGRPMPLEELAALLRA